MNLTLNRLTGKLGSLIMAWLYGAGMALMFVYHEGYTPDTLFIMGYTLLAAAILLVLGLGRKSFWLTSSALLVAAIAALIGGWQPIGAVKAMLGSLSDGTYGAYMNQFALTIAILLILIAYALSLDRHGVFVLLALSLTASAVMWFFGQAPRPKFVFMPLIAVSAQFSVSGALKQTNTKALLSASLIAALLSCAIVPDAGVTFKPLEQASEKSAKKHNRVFQSRQERGRGKAYLQSHILRLAHAI